MEAKKQKRYGNSYKCTSQVYNKAMRRAKKDKVPLAQTIEKFVEAYGSGNNIFDELNSLKAEVLSLTSQLEECSQSF